VIRDRTRLAVTLGCLTVSTAALTLLAGIPGTVAGLLVAGLWLALTPPVAFAVAHLLLVLVVPETGGTLTLFESGPFVLAELGLLCALAVAAVESRTWRTALTVTLGSGLVLVGVAGFALGTLDESWTPALVLLLVIGGVLYTVHRIERVRLGLVREDLE
jgi:hypothetical protein